VNDKLTLDLGYRYLNLGDSPAVAVINDATGQNGGTVQWRNLDSHDIKLGMRWTLGGDCCGAEPEQAIMRKY
jgi:opacity protein-like surface antigen